MAKKTWIGTDGSYSTNANWSPTNVPTGGDEVFIPAGSGSITSGLNQSAVTIASFEVEDGYTGTIGSAAGYLQLDITDTTGKFTYAGRGLAYIDIGNSAISPTIRQTYSPPTGYRGLYLKGSAMATVNAMGGDTGLAAIFGETATVTTVRVVGSNARVVVGPGVTLTTMYQTDGTNQLECAATTTTVHGGYLLTRGAGAVTTFNVYDGQVVSESTGTITTLNTYGGETDFTTSGAPRTVTTLNQKPGSTVTYDPAVVSVGTISAPPSPVRIDMQAA